MKNRDGIRKTRQILDVIVTPRLTSNRMSISRLSQSANMPISDSINQSITALVYDGAVVYHCSCRRWRQKWVKYRCWVRRNHVKNPHPHPTSPPMAITTVRALSLLDTIARSDHQEPHLCWGIWMKNVKQLQTKQAAGGGCVRWICYVIPSSR